MEKSEARNRRLIFPFTAIVGLEKAKLAFLSAAVNPRIGGVLIKGDKGTGKSTLVRALAQILPQIEVVANCKFNCNPHNQTRMCDACYERAMQGEALPTVKRRMRVVDLPLSITVDRLVGTLDIEQALKKGIRALHPGLLAEANQNILYVDEVNLLDDYVADVLLDSAAMGWNVLEREGVSIKHPSQFILSGSMNPEEGELRPQILDRFGLSVDIKASMNPEARCEIVRRVEEFDANPTAFYKKFEPEETELRKKVAKARELLESVLISDDLLCLLAKTIVELGIKTSRAEVVTVKTAKAITALGGRTRVTLKDLEQAMDLSLPNRMKTKPFESQPPMPKLTMQKDKNDKEKEKSNDKSGKKNSQEGVSPSGLHNATGDKVSEHKMGVGENIYETNRNVSVDGLTSNRKSEIATPKPRGARDVRLTTIGYPHGYPVSYVPPRDGETDVDLTATFTLASLRKPELPLSITSDDLRVRVRKIRAPALIVLLLDSSGSMAALRRISHAKGIAFQMVEEAYINRSQVALIVFRGCRAEVVVSPTRNYWELFSALENMRTGGRTPLLSAFQALIDLTKRTRVKCKSLKVKAGLISDGKANVSVGEGNIKENLQKLVAEVRKYGIELTVYDTRPLNVIDPAPSYISLLEETSGAHVFRV